MTPVTSRRTALAAFAALPFALAACSDEGVRDPGSPAPLEGAERDRYLSLAEAWIEAQSALDLDASMAFFSDDPTMMVNGREIGDVARIRAFLQELGVDGAGGLEGLRIDVDHRWFTDNAILLEGRIFGKHTGAVASFHATGNDVKISFMAFCRFDADGRFAEYRAVMDYMQLV